MGCRTPGPRTSPSDVSGGLLHAAVAGAAAFCGDVGTRLSMPCRFGRRTLPSAVSDGRKPYPSAPLLAAWVAGEGERGQGDRSPVSQQTCPHPGGCWSPRLPWWMLAPWLLRTRSGWGRRGASEPQPEPQGLLPAGSPREEHSEPPEGLKQAPVECLRRPFCILGCWRPESEPPPPPSPAQVGASAGRLSGTPKPQCLQCFCPVSPAQGTDCSPTSHLPPCRSLSSDLLSLFLSDSVSPLLAATLAGPVPETRGPLEASAVSSVARLPACLPAWRRPRPPREAVASSLGSALPAPPSLLASGLRSPRRPGLGALPAGPEPSSLAWKPGGLYGGRGGLKILFLTTQEDPDALRAVGPSPPRGWQTAGLLGAESGALSLRGLDCPSVALPSARLASAQG